MFVAYSPTGKSSGGLAVQTQRQSQFPRVELERVVDTVVVSPGFGAPRSVAQSIATVLASSVAPSTLRGYHTAVKHWQAFHYQRLRADAVDWSPQEGLLLHWLHYLADSLRPGKPLMHTTIQKHLTGLRWFVELYGGSPVPFRASIVCAYLRGLKKSFRLTHPRPERLPITYDIFQRLITVSPLARNPVRTASYLAGCGLGFFGLLRGGEYTRKDSDSHILTGKDWTKTFYGATVFLAHSKSDYDHKGVLVKIFALPDHPETCPVAAMDRALSLRPIKHPDAPLLQNDDGSPLTYDFMLRETQRRLELLRFSRRNFGCHSFRIGGATELVYRGVDVATVMVLGRWTSDCAFRYMRTDLGRMRKAVLAMAEPCKSTWGVRGLSLEVASKISADDVEQLPVLLNRQRPQLLVQ